MNPYRHTLSLRQSGQWQHQNPDLARFWQYQIMDRVSDAAIEHGYDQWRIFDVDAGELAWGMDTERLCK